MMLATHKNNIWKRATNCSKSRTKKRPQKLQLENIKIGKLSMWLLHNVLNFISIYPFGNTIYPALRVAQARVLGEAPVEVG